jgi:hypothetical protein
MSRRRCSSWDAAGSFRYTRKPVEPPTPRVNHRLHLGLSVITGGVWVVLVWWWLPWWARSQHRQAMLVYASEMTVWESIQAARAARERAAAAVAATEPPRRPELPSRYDPDRTVELPAVTVDGQPR